MTKDFYDKLTTWSDVVSKNKAILILILGMLGSGATNTFQYLSSLEGTFLQNVMKDQITLLAKTYVNKECEK